MINERIGWIKQICDELYGMRRGVATTYLLGKDPLTLLKNSLKDNPFHVEGSDYADYNAPILERILALALRYEGYAYTSQTLEDAHSALSTALRKLETPNVKLRGAALLRRPSSTPGWASAS